MVAILIGALLPTAITAATSAVDAHPPLALCGDSSSGAPAKHDSSSPLFQHCVLCCLGAHSLAPGLGGLLPRPDAAAILVQLSWSLKPLPSLRDLRGAVLPRGPPVAA